MQAWKLLLLAPAVLADSHEDSEYEDDVTERGWEIEEESEDRVRLSGVTVAGNREDEIDFEFRQRDNGFEFRLEYSSEAGSTETEYDFRFRTFRLIEYVPDENAASVGFNPDTSTIVQELDLAEWDPATLSNPETNLYRVSSTTLDGVLTIDAYVSDISSTVGGWLLDPNAVKSDISIQGFPYTGEGSRLALEATMRFQVELEEEADTEDTENSYTKIEFESVPGAESIVALDWLKTAQYGESKMTMPVIASEYYLLAQGDDALDDEAEDGDTECKIYFSFDAVQPDPIYWDPEVGVKYIGSTATFVAPSLAAFASMALFGLYLF